MMNVRKLAMTVVLATASAFALASPASAQSFGGITLSFGSGGYNSYSYDDDDNYPASSYYTYGVPQYQNYSYYSRPSYEWQERARLEQWRAAQQRRLYWEHERREHQHWRDDDDDN
ncbi:hypothetical protein GCM10008023_40150 [Sphingomonas glacialis]|uniref:Uncharacterized protein n=1 Tax=Sphingomonas glacialis TaxID=658225 RepID=A0ABQ3M0F0_9SPHN|nr:hypothetical protein [Sphingomonas glacialis]GHH26080.1 hypothetical protein GCM10008023_40150 [Sphingomonas glacialis]